MDDKLLRHCFFGLLGSILFGLNIFPSASVLMSIWLYRNVKLSGGVFFQLQFDNLVIETGWIACLAFLSPLQWISFSFSSPLSFSSRCAVFLLHFLLFRLLFSSGIVKLTSKDPVWANCSALQFHYFTQPLPLRGGFALHHLFPAVLHRLCCFVHFILELVVPFMFFVGPLQMVAFCLSLSLQMMILLTGHYGHFNVLTIVISFSLFSSSSSSTSQWPEDARSFLVVLLSRVWDPLCACLAAAFVVSLLLCSVVPFGQLGKRCGELTGVLKLLASQMDGIYRTWIARYGLLHPYGLFAVMTTTRKELIIEGSNDGKDWREYELPYKPGLSGRGELLWFILPPLHLPRLDWRLWFCPLRGGAPDAWVSTLQQRLLNGRVEVLNLFSVVPFDIPPKFIRIDVYMFEFATEQERKRTGNFWIRRKLGPFLSATMK